MNRRFSQCAMALTLAILAAASPKVAQAQEADITPQSTATTTNANNVEPVAETAPTLDVTNLDVEVPVLSESTPLAAVETMETDTPAITESSAITTQNQEDVPAVEGQAVDLRILATTDLHTNLVNYDYYQDKPVETLGLAKTAVLIEEAKAENPNVIMVDNGDTIQGTPLGNYKSLIDPIDDDEQHPMYQALEALGFDAGTLGNHEFNYGLAYLDKVIRTANIPLVNANVLDPTSKDFIYNPYTIVKKTLTDIKGNPVTLNIGITGIVPPQILNWDKAYLEGKVIVRDAVEAVRDIIPTMRQMGADLVLVLSHSGIGDDKYDVGEENVGYQIASLPGVDAVVTGHSHAEFPGTAGKPSFYAKYAGVDDTNGKINGTPVTMAGKYGDHLGIIDLSLLYTDGKWTTTSSQATIRKIDTKSSLADSRIIDLAQEAHKETINYVRQKVGESTAPINSFFALVQDDPSVQIVNNAQIWYAKQQLAGTPEASLPILSAAAPFKAGTRGDASAYTDIPVGAIAIKNVADLYLYDNVVAILKVNGAQLKEWLEMAAGQFNQIDPTLTTPQQLINPDFRTYNFDVIDGITYQYDITQPVKYDRNGKVINESANRVRNLHYQGQEVTSDQEFIVVTNNYRANGTFPGVREASLNRLLNLENRQAIINYIISEKVINPTADKNWTFTDTIKDLDLRFLTAERAKDLLTPQDNLIYLQPSGTSEGFGEFRFVYVEPKAVTPEDKELAVSQEKEKTPPKRDIILDSGQRITLPSQATQTSFRQANLQTVASSQPSATAKQDEKALSDKTLPKTGESTSLLSLIGLWTLGLIGYTKKRAKN
ncbi:bifunctional 2',3'-cyclic-nucleotide 2'-phosphodiesterase/3'-nucleotidase [Streptococcus sp. zg-JUN1979]|uniref:bifunctional 2',3'-cyclic-nucleotide 2'-phosphodiesterase/3'-nucleotidase n=1 Tax=Streptococcus sp. zg-JUN1979 TaxID=3391450 RepID=UPI0039B0EBE2